MIALQLRGVFRPIDSPKSLQFVFNRQPTDDELRALHDHMREKVLPAGVEAPSQVFFIETFAREGHGG